MIFFERVELSFLVSLTTNLFVYIFLPFVQKKDMQFEICVAFQ